MFRQFIEYLKMKPVLDDPKKLRDIQEKRLKKIVQQAYDTIPFYKQLLDTKDIKPEDIQTLEDLSHLPIIDKNMLKRTKKSTVSSKYKKKELIRERTSGSTGNPFAVYRTKEAHHIENAAKFRAYIQHGYSPFWKIYRLNLLKPPKKKVFHIFGIHRLYSSPMSESYEEITKRMMKIKPQVLDSYPGRIDGFIDYLKKHNISMPFIKQVYSSSGTMISSIRKKIRDYFGVEPIDCYATMEFKYVAMTTPQSKDFRIFADIVLVEVVDENGIAVKPGEMGTLVLTSLVNDAMPFIRYNMQDMAVLSKDGLSITKLVGRVTSFITLESGVRLPANELIVDIFDPFFQINRFRVHQQKDLSLKVEVELEPGTTLPEKRVQSRIRRYTKGLSASISYVDNWNLKDNQKFEVFTSVV